MKYIFPKIDLGLRYTLSYIYQNKEDFDIISKADIAKCEAFLKTRDSRNWQLRCRRFYNNESIIESEEIYGNNEELLFINKYSASEKMIMGIFEDETIRWHFNNDNFLSRETRAYDDDGDSLWDFELDSSNNLIRINEFEIHRENDLTTKIFNHKLQRFTVKSITHDPLLRKMEIVNYENLKEILFFDENENVIKRINNYGVVTIIDFQSKSEFDSYRLDKNGKKSIQYSRRESIEGKIRTSLETKFDDNANVEYIFKEVNYLK